ncbi:hypothetical protein GGF32_006953 [Allomyces javanicus]|nr:hypothetical protein GGF32_006953 [Allomyces javanicus]
MDWRYSPLFNYLDSGEFLSSKNGKYHLVMEPSGDLALYDSWLWIAPYWLWSSKSARKGDGAPYTLEISLDRSATSAVHIMSKSGATAWDMGVCKEPTANCLYVLDEGKIVVSDFFCCEIFHTIEPAPKFRGSFMGTALPSIRDAMGTAVAMQDAILSCMLGDTVADVLVKMLSKKIDEVVTDFSSASATAKTLGQKYDAVLDSLADIKWQRERAEQAVKDAEARHERQVQERSKASKFELLDGKWLNVYKYEEIQWHKPLNDLNAQLVAIYMVKYEADGKTEMAQLQHARLEAEMDVLNKERHQLRPRILERDASLGLVTMAPLIRVLKDVVREVVAMELLDEIEAEMLQISMSDIESKGEQIRQLKIESSKSLEDFFC